PLSLEPQVGIFAPNQKPRVEQPTYYWLQMMGRLKPGVAPEQAQGNLGGVFQSTARAGLDSYLKGLSETERAASGNRNRTEVAELRAEPGAHGIYDANSTEKRSATILFVVVGLVLLI